MPTCMSAAPRSTGCARFGDQAQAALVGAHRVAEAALRDPDVGQGDGAADRRRTVARPAAGWRSQSVQDRCAASRSPLAQYARPRSPAADPRLRWSSGSTSSSARSAWVMVPADVADGHGQGRPIDAIERGRRRNSSSSTTIRPAELPAGRSWPSAADRATVRRPAGAPRRRRARPMRRAAPRRSGRSARAGRRDVVGQRLKPARGVTASCRLLRIAGTASSIRSAARSKSAGGQRVADGLGRLAVLLVPLARPPVQARDTIGLLVEQVALAARRRRGGGSDTSGGGRRAGPGTGSRDPAPRAWPCRRRGR